MKHRLRQHLHYGDFSHIPVGWAYSPTLAWLASATVGKGLPPDGIADMNDLASTMPNAASIAHQSRQPAWLKLLLALAIVAGASFGLERLWTRVLHDNFYPRNWGVVEPGRIFRSGLISHRVIRKTLEDNHVGMVLHMSGDDPHVYDAIFERDLCAELHIDRFTYNLSGDGTGNPAFYVDALAHLAAADRAGTPVLVHCKTGAQRTGGMILLYRVLIQGKPVKEAYAELLQYGHDPQKNTALIPYLNDHIREIAQGLVDRHIIRQVPDPLPVIQP